MSSAAINKFSKQRLKRNMSSEKPEANAPKRSIPQPLSVQEFVGIFIYYVFRKPLQVSPQTRAGVYLAAVIIFSVVFDLLPFPKTFLANKKSFLNIVFVKWAWGWTFCVSAFFIFYCSLILTVKNIEIMRKHLTRLAFGTAVWYICTNLFHMIENATGHCSLTPDTILTNVTNRRDCTHEHNAAWLGFDISGHVFLLTWCNLVISEETAVLKDWVKLGDLLKEEVDTGGRRMTSERAKAMMYLYQSFTFGVKSSAVVLSLLSIIWDVMLCGTVVYFHTMPSKLTAVLFAVGSWLLVYKGIILPGYLTSIVVKPGDSELKFLSSS